MKVKTIVKSVLKKMLDPRTLLILMKIRRDKKKNKPHEYVDPYLKAYSNMFPGQSLHLPYFSDPHVHPDEISMSDIEKGGIAYWNLIIDHIADKKSPVLDVGCGLGGLCKLLLKRGYKPVGLTPDGYQYEYIKKNLPKVQVIKNTFEKLDDTSFKHHFGTIITSESLQYLKLDQAFAIIDDILKPGGHYIICDYFKRTEKSSIKNQHPWDVFLKKIGQRNWKIVFQRDITDNVVPFLGYCFNLSKRVLFPIMDYFMDDLKKKKPGLSYLFEDTFKSIKTDIGNRLQYIDPEIFFQERKYMLLVVRR